MGEEPSREVEGSCAGDDVLDWLRSDEAIVVASRWVERRRLPGGRATAEDVLADASVAMLVHVRRHPDARYDRPGAYGTALIRNTVSRMLRGRSSLDETWLDPDVERPAPPDEAIDPTVADGVRVALERVGSGAPWITSAALSYLTLTLHPESTPEDLPRPLAGADESHARCWPALWVAGQRQWFGDPSQSVRRTRARRIRQVLDRVELAVDEIRRSATDAEQVRS